MAEPEDANPADAGQSDVVAAAEPSTRPPSRGEVEGALRFVNRQLVDGRQAQADSEATVRALVETLVSVGALPHGEFERRRQRLVASAKAADAEPPLVKLAEPVDKYALGPLPDVDCAGLMPICKARCCKLTVFCSVQDLDERVVQWEYSRPYQLRKRDDSYCVHSEPESGRCGVYTHRPAVCRTYDCRNDRRIWRDFARRIPVDG
jgi:Putative zinc- or iron-chelating domain